MKKSSEYYDKIVDVLGGQIAVGKVYKTILKLEYKGKSSKCLLSLNKVISDIKKLIPDRVVEITESDTTLTDNSQIENSESPKNIEISDSQEKNFQRSNLDSPCRTSLQEFDGIEESSVSPPKETNIRDQVEIIELTDKIDDVHIEESHAVLVELQPDEAKPEQELKSKELSIVNYHNDENISTQILETNEASLLKPKCKFRCQWNVTLRTLLLSIERLTLEWVELENMFRSSLSNDERTALKPSEVSKQFVINA